MFFSFIIPVVKPLIFLCVSPCHPELAEVPLCLSVVVLDPTSSQFPQNELSSRAVARDLPLTTPASFYTVPPVISEQSDESPDCHINFGGYKDSLLFLNHTD
jgi:hypothetical protein